MFWTTTLAMLLAAVSLQAQELTADEVVARHLEARGGANRLKAMTSVVYRNGTYREGSYTGAGRAFMAMARPYFKIVGDPSDTTSDFREGYDGSAWEWYRSPGLVVRTVGAANAAIRHNLDPDGALSDFRAKGSSIERMADDAVGGRQAFAIRLTLGDGYRAVILIDGETFLITAVRKTAAIHAFGAAVTSEERFSDYRPVDGILFPFHATETEISTGKELNSMQWGVIEVNRDLPPEWFSPPAFVRTGLQQFLEQLYYERSDVSALEWSYRAFRRARPDVDTRAGIEAIGFQILKMGDHAGAISVLMMNERDYPQSSSAAFGVGRALATAGDTVRARPAFERALRLDPNNKRAADALAALGSTSSSGAVPQEVGSGQVLIPAGTFSMGTDSAEVAALLARYGARRVELFANEVPRRSVRVAAFWMDRNEVTQAAFQSFVLAKPEWRKDALPAHAHNGRYLEDWTETQFAAGEGKLPVAFITWDAARAYCAWIGGRLPSEAEWEYAASGGHSRPEFPWGDERPDSSRANALASGLGRATDVGRYAPNGYGLHDMAGNVWEFVADRWEEAADVSNAAPADGPQTRYVIRGGSYGGAIINLRVRYRDSHRAGHPGAHVGFRCARSG